jgi:bifunctional UDP-N-acetylglucosamine pyrophosphorylase/glucosamine-1-phosphate N-acetyltransferase/UDP-N-acetylglucosamine pyrophosphorylase
MKNKVAAVILAAGLGTRMKSDKAKVLHTILGRAMVLYVVETAQKIAGENIVVVIGYQAQQVRQIVSDCCKTQFALQEQQLGTGHAVLCAMPQISNEIEHVIILCGDTPLLSHVTLQTLLCGHLEQNRDLSLLAVNVQNPTGYGRILLDHRGQLAGIVEEADADGEVKKITLINSGIYCVRKAFLADALAKIDANNAQRELYLTDIIGVGYREDRAIGAVIGSDPEEILGVNSQVELNLAEQIMKRRDREIA